MSITSVFKAFCGAETVSQNFPTAFQNAVEARCITTTKILWNLASWSCRHSDEIAAVSKFIKDHQGQTLKKTEHNVRHW